MKVDTRHGIHITEEAGSYHMSYENWQINLKACQTLRSQSSDAFVVVVFVVVVVVVVVVIQISTMLTSILASFLNTKYGSSLCFNP